MPEIIHFIPQKDLTARQNLRDFIVVAKDHLTTWSNIPGFEWESSRWETTYHTIRFLNYENSKVHPCAVLQSHQLMHPSFIPIAKAYLRYRHNINPTKQIANEAQALRVLEFTLREDMGTPDITKMSQRHFDAATAYLTRDFKSAANISAALLRILRSLAEWFIITGDALYWVHPFKGKKSYHYTNGGGAPQSVKDEKVASQDALLAIGEVFRRGYAQQLEDVDLMVTSLTAILLSAPMRLGETVRFRVDCLGTEQDKDGKTQYYLKYWVPKTKEYARKPIPEVMAESAIEAIRRLTVITEEGRRLARYLETNPTRFYRHANCPDVPDAQELTPDQVVQALGFESVSSATAYIKRRTGSYAITGLTLNSLWQIVLEDHRASNPHFPYQEAFDGVGARPPKMSESLMCTLRLQFSTRQKTGPVFLSPFSKSYYSVRLAAQLKKNRRPMCFFQRHGFESIQFRSHGIRHFLNRMAKRSGISTEVITAWSNRSSVRQTLTYLDNDRGEAANEVSSLMGVTKEQESKSPISDDELSIYSDGPIHRSRYGLCRRSWKIGPCNKFGDCLNCSDLLMCKGDKVAAEIVAADRDNLVKTYNAAQDAVQRGERSATRWLSVSRPQIVRLNQLLSILEDPSIDDGNPIEIAGSNFSHEQTLVNEKVLESGLKLLDRNKLSINYGKDLLACLDELRTR